MRELAHMLSIRRNSARSCALLPPFDQGTPLNPVLKEGRHSAGKGEGSVKKKRRCHLVGCVSRFGAMVGEIAGRHARRQNNKNLGGSAALLWKP